MLSLVLAVELFVAMFVEVISFALDMAVGATWALPVMEEVFLVSLPAGSVSVAVISLLLDMAGGGYEASDIGLLKVLGLAAVR